MSDNPNAPRQETLGQRLGRLDRIVKHVSHLNREDRRWLREWLMDSQVERDLLAAEARRERAND